MLSPGYQSILINIWDICIAYLSTGLFVLYVEQSNMLNKIMFCRKTTTSQERAAILEMFCSLAVVSFSFNLKIVTPKHLTKYQC